MSDNVELLQKITRTYCSLLVSGLGQSDSEYVDVGNLTSYLDQEMALSLTESSGRAGFANKTNGEHKLLPCSVGTFVNSKISDPTELKCLECPPGKIFNTSLKNN